MLRYLFKNSFQKLSLINKFNNKSKFSTQYVASIDQSTTSTKFSIFTTKGKLIQQEIIQHKQYSPNEGFLEHDPNQIIQNVHEAMRNVIERMKSKQNFKINSLIGVGVCNQRETIVCWDKQGKPLYNAIAWCDARTKQVCQNFKAKFGQFKGKTGLPVSTYFSLFKIIWLLENVPLVKQHLQSGNIRFGTIDSWVTYNLTGKYVTDASNASRTYLANLEGQWDQQMLNLYGLKKDYFPQIIDSFVNIGQIKKGVLEGISISSILGDQQSSAYAHTLQKNQMKITYGTGCFLLNNIGNAPKIHESFITTILNKHKNKIQYGYQAAVECGGGTLNWAKRTAFFNSYKQLNSLQVPKNEVIFLPSFGSIFAPFWKDGVQGGFLGLNFNTTRQDLLYSILESIVFRLNDNIKDKQFQNVKKILADGGMTTNQMFMQMNSNTFKKYIQVCQLDTCWGVAKGVLTTHNIQHPNVQKINNIYSPDLQNQQNMAKRYQSWNKRRHSFYNWK